VSTAEVGIARPCSGTGGTMQIRGGARQRRERSREAGLDWRTSVESLGRIRMFASCLLASGRGVQFGRGNV